MSSLHARLARNLIRAFDFAKAARLANSLCSTSPLGAENSCHCILFRFRGLCGRSVVVRLLRLGVIHCFGEEGFHLRYGLSSSRGTEGT